MVPGCGAPRKIDDLQIDKLSGAFHEDGTEKPMIVKKEYDPAIAPGGKENGHDSFRSKVWSNLKMHWLLA